MFNENDVLRTTLVMTLIISAVVMFLNTRASLGILLGGLMSVLAFRLMIIDGTRFLQKAKQGTVDAKGAYRLTFKGFAKRCLFYSLALIVAIVNPSLSFMGTLIGLLMPRLAILYHLIHGRIKRGT
jgi:hypothetical protein|nr:ATP synthase subunit I [Bacillota bacterium]